MSHRSTHAPKLSARHSIVNSLALAALAASFVAGLARTAPAILVYDRNAAVAYADANWNKVVSDGYFWINGSNFIHYGAGAAVPVGVPNEDGVGDDCAHFVSSVLGTPGGGLTIPSRAQPTYGEPGAAALDELLVGSSSRYGATYKYGQLVSSVSQLTPGDVIGYDWKGDGHGSMDGIDHTVVYMGDNKVNYHSTSRQGDPWDLGAAYYFFIHITLPDNIVPTTPRNVSPAASSSVSDLTPMLTASAFSDGAIGSTHVAAEWKILNSRGTSVYDSGTDTTNLTSLTVPDGKLIAGGSYTWQVRYQDNYGDWSSYSTATSLTMTIPGDYNRDGVVNAADYVAWRNDPNDFGGTPDGYNTWRANFGNTTGSGTALASALSQSAVPEPTSAVCLSGLLLVFAWRNGRRAEF